MFISSSFRYTKQTSKNVGNTTFIVDIFLLICFSYLYIFRMFWVHKVLYNCFFLSPERNIKRCLCNLFGQKRKLIRGQSRAPLTLKVELFVTIVNSFQPLTIITMKPILDTGGLLYISAFADDLSLLTVKYCRKPSFFFVRSLREKKALQMLFLVKLHFYKRYNITK